MHLLNPVQMDIFSLKPVLGLTMICKYCKKEFKGKEAINCLIFTWERSQWRNDGDLWRAAASARR